jgi:cyanophycinase
MQSRLRPIYLLADSQLLFWGDERNLLLDSVGSMARQGAVRAAYIGASNGDAPEFYEIFEAAMNAAGVRRCRMILSSFSGADESFVSTADIILLAGGDVERGWRVIDAVGLKGLITRRYFEGALLIGISAGAVQLGPFALAGENASGKLIEMLKLVPFVVGAHEEQQRWAGLRRAVLSLNGRANGVGIPAGGGLAYYPDQSVGAIRHPLVELTMSGGVVVERSRPPRPPR